MDTPFSIVVVTQARGAEISAALAPLAPHRSLELLPPDHPLPEMDQVDVMILDLDQPQRFEALMVDAEKRATVALCEKSSPDLIRIACRAGVRAVCEDLAQLPAQVVLAHETFLQMEELRQQLRHSKRALQERKVIDRAKGILMQAKGLDEAQAYKVLRQNAMQQGRRIADVAGAIVTASALLS